ncbi:hypothetical protein R1flu_026318 [Riccia fluitans]|uniref:At3g05675-like ankyrin-like domain-containing protein n=1 Tax=Riccia fluitans TaxID=41844 RepID=A0ABD1XFL4_9MARC
MKVVERRRMIGLRMAETLTFYMTSCAARTLLMFLPQRIDICGISNALESFGANEKPRAIVRIADSEQGDQLTVKSSGGGSSGMVQALLQILALVNELPASSMKYNFARNLAEQILAENARHGQGFECVNRMALSAGFQRTLGILHGTLAGVHREQEVETVCSLPMKVIRMLSSAGMALPLPAPFSHMRMTLFGGLVGSIMQSGDQVYQSSRVVYDDNRSMMSEKLAQELLWLAQKLSEYSALEEGIIQWSSSNLLATMAVSSSPRVQRSLVRLSALLIDGMMSGKVEVSRETKFKMLLHWIPLFCTATHGVDGVIFNNSEKAEAQETLDQAIRSLPESDQEVLLAIWLQEYAMSLSDWPNLQNCYYNWCHTVRKLGSQGQITA